MIAARDGADPYSVCAVIPTFDNPKTVAAVVRGTLEYLDCVILVDDGSGIEARGVLDRLAGDSHVRLVRRVRNGGKGAALKTGLRQAVICGFSHALQIDADGQHDLGSISEFLGASRADPQALVLGYPVFDATVPRGRLWGRQITRWWTRVEVGGPTIIDPMIGCRVYPLASAAVIRPVGDRMQVDTELAVRLVWRGVPVINLPVRVRYLTAEEGGVSHFRMVHDNVAISWMHSRLVTTALVSKLVGRRSGNP